VLRFSQYVALALLCISSVAAYGSDGPLLQQGDNEQASQPSGRSLAIADDMALWPSGIVPYTIAPSVPAASVEVIKEAIAHWNAVGGISVVPLAEARIHSDEAILDSVHFVPGDFCASWVGRQGAQQELWVASYCSAGSVMHEIGHVLGLEHEHTRPDRDQHIRIHWDNIKQDKQHNFDPAPVGARMLSDYDLDSIMHYGTHNFSSNGQPTISRLDGLDRRIGQRLSPSEGDLNAIARLYGTDLSMITRVDINEQRSELAIFVSNNSLRGAHDIQVSIAFESDVQVSATLPESWTCDHTNKAEQTRNTDPTRNITCRTHTMKSSATAVLTLAVPTLSLANRAQVTLSSNTPDLEMSNNARDVQLDDEGDVPIRDGALDALGPAFEKDDAFNNEKNDDKVYANVGRGALEGWFLLLFTIVAGLLTAHRAGRWPGQFRVVGIVRRRTWEAIGRRVS